MSYRRTDPDQLLARSLVDALEKQGQSVFWDNRIIVGKKWADVIDQRIRESDVFIVLISEDSMRSDMVRGEIQLAHELSRRLEDPLAILPVRVDYLGELPYDLGAYLNPIQYVIWKGEADSPKIAEQLLAAISGGEQLPERRELSAASIEQLFEATEKKGAPLPEAELRFETGTVKLDSSFYVVRSEDARALRSVTGEGTTTVIKGVRQIGKSSLLARAIAAAKTAKFRTFYLDFQSLEQAQFKDLSTLLKILARRIARELRPVAQPEEFWNEDDGPKFCVSEFLRHAVLTPSEPPLALFLDEVDLVFAQPEYRDDFFSTFRFWHNERANNPDTWNRLNIVIAHSTEPSMWIQDIHQSPFNVGDRIRLREFTVAQIADLNKRYGHVLKTDTEVTKLHELVGGHPYLVRQALYSIGSNEWSFAELERQSAESDGPFGDHLKRYLFLISKDPGLKAALKSALTSASCEDENHFQRLAAFGLVEGSDRRSLRARCRLYERYFPDHL